MYVFLSAFCYGLFLRSSVKPLLKSRVINASFDHLCIVEIADKDAERAMAFLKEAYPFNEETEVFIRKRYNMSIDVDPEEN